MADWNPDRYRRFEAQRTRPAADLLAQVEAEGRGLVIDLGCGPGNSTELLVRRFGADRVLGMDSSPAMVAAARARLPQARFEAGDVTSFQPPEAPEILFSNAVLQWVPDHADLVPRLFGLLAPGGWLAFQVPDNLDEPSHRAMREVAGSGPWSSRLGEASRLRERSVLAAEAYYDLLGEGAAQVDIWRTVYHHPMPTPAAIVDWLRSTGLRPFLDPLTAEERDGFLAAYEAAVDAAYPARSDGTRLLAFPRLFVVARRPG